MKLLKYFVPNPGTLLVVGLFLLAQSVFGSPAAPALTQAPSATFISYQGKLADTGGNPITTSPEGIGMKFALYNVSTGGSSCWSETQTVSVSNGLFNVLLGRGNGGTGVPSHCLSGDVYLGITVGNDSEMTPREQLTSVPFAVQAQSLPNMTVAGEYIGIGTDSPTGPLHVVGSGSNWAGRFEDGNESDVRLGFKGNGIYAISRASGNPALLQLWSQVDSNVNPVMSVFKDGNVGIGTESPGAKLDVNGNIRLLNSLTSTEANSALYLQPGPNSYVTMLNAVGNGVATFQAGEGSSIATYFQPGATHVASFYKSADTSQIAMRIDSGGHVGIGTTSPSAKLHIKKLDPVEVKLERDAGGSLDLTYLYDTKHRIGFTTGGTPGNWLFRVDYPDGTTQLAPGGGNVGIGTASPGEKLQVAGNIQASGSGGQPPRFNSPSGSDLVIDAGQGSHNTLILHDDVDIHDGDLKVGNDHKVFTSWLGSEGGKDLTIDAGLNSNNKIRLTDHLDMQFYDIERVDEIWARSAYCGALVESGLQTEEELASERIERFTEGDLQCWSTKTERLERCTMAHDPLVQSVADVEGRPIVMGAELVKVIGPVQPGDLLVSSNEPGYAMVNNHPAPGTVIAQALEEFCEETGIIKAMIRKF